MVQAGIAESVKRLASVKVETSVVQVRMTMVCTMSYFVRHYISFVRKQTLLISIFERSIGSNTYDMYMYFYSPTMTHVGAVPLQVPPASQVLVAAPFMLYPVLQL